MNTPLLQVNNLKTYFPLRKGVIIRRHAGYLKAVDDVSLTLNQGEILGLVGESGCGKTSLGRTLMRLIKPYAGSIILDGDHLENLNENELRPLRKKIQMVFQDPYASLNPRMTIYDILAEPLLIHKITNKKNLDEKIAKLMDRVGLARRFIKKYPHEFSGGQRQRIAIARAIAPEPKLIVADEPVSALDVSIQAQIINLLSNLSKEMGLSLVFISHDLSVVKHISNRIAIMYLGKIVETGPSDDVFENPKHPYAKALLSSIPLPDPIKERQRERIILTGDLPSPMDPPPGCHFAPRCPFAIQDCTKAEPPAKVVGLGHTASCIRI